MQDRLRLMFQAIENHPLTLGSWAVALMAVIAIRIGIENFFESFPFRFADQFFYQFAHHFLTFTTIYLVSLPIVIWAGKIEVRKAANILLAGFLIIWTPPVVDEIISRGAGLWSFYSFDSLIGLLERYITFFGDKPDVGITYGVRFEVGAVVLLIALYTWIKSRSVMRTLVASLALYTALFIIGVLPSIVTLLLFGPHLGFLAITEQDVARLMLTPSPLFVLSPPDIASVLAIKMSLVYGVTLVTVTAPLAWFFFRPLLTALWHNTRLPQMFFQAGQLILGATLTFFYGTTSFHLDLFHILGALLLLIAVQYAWLASVVQNDIRDLAIDRITNPSRPLVTKAIDLPTYRTIGFLFFAASVFLAALISTQAALLLVLYQGLAFLYSADPFRLKRFPIIATALASLASLLILCAGFLVFSAEKNITAIPISMLTLLFFAYLVLIPIKDFKDIAGDALDKVMTLPVILGADRAKRVIGSLFFLVAVITPFVLGLKSLFPLGLFFGGLGYWMLALSTDNHRHLSYRKLPGWFIVLVTGYGTFIALALMRQ